MLWMIEDTEREQAIEQVAYLQALEVRSDAQIAADLGMTVEAVAEARALGESMPQLEVEAGTAVIEVSGVLLPRVPWLAKVFGIDATEYGAITAQLAEAESRGDVHSVQLNVSSPGGSVDGIAPVVDALAASRKPTTARVSGLAASAAYWIASQADAVVATSRTDRVGSIGVAVSVPVNSKRIDIASTDAPNKRPDVQTAEGRAVIRQQLDAMHDLFVADVARGRGVSAETVRADFGGGSVLLAAQALSAGMIDAAPATARQSAPVSASIVIDMTPEKLKAEHPEIYTAIFDAGVSAERLRVIEHLDLGVEAGAESVALQSVRSGEAVTHATGLRYVKAAMSQTKIAERAKESAEAAPTKAPAPANSEADSLSRMVAQAAYNAGIELN